METNYTISKPSLPPAAYGLGAAVIIGLIGLGAVAFHVFSLVDPWPVALCFALVIEVGAAAEAMAILRKNRLAIAGAVVSVLVSGTYNITRIQQAKLQISPFEAAALAIGPLSAVLFLALSLSHELQQHEAAVRQWEEKRQAWQDHQADLAQRRRDRQEFKLAQMQTASTATAPVTPTANPDSLSVVTLPTADTGSYNDFVSVMRGRNGSGPLTVAEIRQRFGVSDRTAFRWLAKYEDDHPQPDIVRQIN